MSGQRRAEMIRAVEQWQADREAWRAAGRGANFPPPWPFCFTDTAALILDLQGELDGNRQDGKST